VFYNEGFCYEYEHKPDIMPLTIVGKVVTDFNHLISCQVIEESIEKFARDLSTNFGRPILEKDRFAFFNL
jgi:hypothetical protein